MSEVFYHRQQHHETFSQDCSQSDGHLSFLVPLKSERDEDLPALEILPIPKFGQSYLGFLESIVKIF